MKEVSVKFEYDGFTIYADGEVWSEALVSNVSIEFEGMNLKDVDNETYRIAKELAVEELCTNVYGSELNF